MAEAERLLEHKYYIDESLNLIYCPKVQLASTYRVFNETRFVFEPLLGGKRISIEKAWEIQTEHVAGFIDALFHNEIGDELPQLHMNWLMAFDSLDDWESYLQEDDYLFNYLILKLQLLGVDQMIATEYASHIVQMWEQRIIAHPRALIESIHRLLSRKRYWVPNYLVFEKEREAQFIQDVCLQRLKRGPAFDFASVKDQYFQHCHSSFMNGVVPFNAEAGYLVSQPLTLVDQHDWLIAVYESHIAGILTYIATDIYPELQHEEYFCRTLIQQLRAVFELYINILESEYN